MKLRDAIEKIVTCAIEKELPDFKLESVTESATGTLYTISLTNTEINFPLTVSIKRNLNQEDLIKGGSETSTKWVRDSPTNIKTIFYKELVLKQFEALKNAKN